MANMSTNNLKCEKNHELYISHVAHCPPPPAKNKLLKPFVNHIAWELKQATNNALSQVSAHEICQQMITLSTRQSSFVTTGGIPRMPLPPGSPPGSLLLNFLCHFRFTSS